MYKSLSSLTPDYIKHLGISELNQLASEIRKFLINSTCNTGGHIGANLGVVELSLALHKVFDSPEDRIFFDTGHIGYTHKIVTGRADDFVSLNTFGGMSRFITPTESPHDLVEVSHAGTAISLAIGSAIANRNKGSKSWSIAVIGDGSLSEGVALEAINHISTINDLRLLIVVNDNGFAISQNSGGINENLKNLASPDFTGSNFFESLSLDYQGPIDGHDINELITTFSNALEVSVPRVIHVLTEKGRGLPIAANHPYKMHYSFPFDETTGKPLIQQEGQPYQNFAAKAIYDAMDSNPCVYVTTPSTLYATGLEPAFSKFSDRCFDPGMSEQHALSMSVGLAVAGMHPVAFYQSTFLQRGFDQVIHDICFTNKDFLICAVRSGFAGYDNPTHHGVYDIAYLGGIPNLNIYYPNGADDIYTTVTKCLQKGSGPSLVLLPYGFTTEELSLDYQDTIEDISFSKKGSSGLCMLAMGNKINDCLDAANLLDKQGVDASVIHLRKIRPLNEELLTNLVSNFSHLIVVEEHVSANGVGSMVAYSILKNGLNIKLDTINVPDCFAPPGDAIELSRLYGLDVDSIKEKAWEFYNA